MNSNFWPQIPGDGPKCVCRLLGTSSVTISYQSNEITGLRTKQTILDASAERVEIVSLLGILPPRCVLSTLYVVAESSARFASIGGGEADRADRRGTVGMGGGKEVSVCI